MEKKRSLKYLLVSVCLALLLASVGGVIAGATNSVNVDDTLEIKGATIDLGDDLGLAFAVPTDAWTETMKLEIYYTNPADTVGDAKQTLTKYDRKLDDEGNPVIVNGCYVVVSGGFEPAAVCKAVYARLVDGTTYGETLKTGVLELVHLMKNQVETKEEKTEEDEIRLGLYNAIIEYEAVVRKEVKNDETNYHFVKVEDAVIIDENGDAQDYALVKENTFFDVEPTISTGNYQLAGWSADGESITHANVGGQVKAYDSVTLRPLFRAAAMYSSNFESLENSATDGALTSGGVTGQLLTFSQLALADEGTEYRNNVVQGNSDAAHGKHGYDYATNSFWVDGSGKNAKGWNSYAQLTLPNPLLNAGTVSHSTVLEFTVNVPSQDNDGDGVNNEVNGDIYHNGISSVNGSQGAYEMMFNIAVGYDANANHAVNFESEIMFNLLILSDTKSSTGNVSGWSLGSYEAKTEHLTGGHTLDYNGVFSGNASTTPKYSFNEDHSIKIVISPGTYADSKLTYGASGSLARADIYVDEVLHHSRIYKETKTSTTRSFQDRTLGFGQNFSVARFTESKYIGISAGAAEHCIAKLNVKDLHTYAGIAVANAADNVVNFTNSTGDVYKHANHGTAMYLDAPLLTEAELIEEFGYTVVENSSNPIITIDYGDTDAKVYKTWNTVASDKLVDGDTGHGRTSVTAGANFTWAYNNDVLSVTRSAVATSNNTRVPLYANNPLRGMTADTYDGELLVFEFKLQLPTQSNDGNTTPNQYSDFNKATSALHYNIAFGFKSDEAFNGNTLVQLQTTLDKNPSSASDTGVMNTYGIRTYAKNVSTERNIETRFGIDEWVSVKIIVKPTSDGKVEYVDIGINGDWHRKYDDAADTKFSAAKGFVDDTNLFAYNGSLCGVAIIPASNNSYGTLNIKDVNCYLIKLVK